MVSSIVWPVEYKIVTEKENKKQIWIIFRRALKLLKGNKNQKTIQVMWQYICLH